MHALLNFLMNTHLLYLYIVKLSHALPIYFVLSSRENLYYYHSSLCGFLNCIGKDQSTNNISTIVTTKAWNAHLYLMRVGWPSKQKVSTTLMREKTQVF